MTDRIDPAHVAAWTERRDDWGRRFRYGAFTEQQFRLRLAELGYKGEALDVEIKWWGQTDRFGLIS